jgi:hypothetical protein
MRYNPLLRPRALTTRYRRSSKLRLDPIHFPNLRPLGQRPLLHQRKIAEQTKRRARTHLLCNGARSLTSLDASGDPLGDNPELMDETNATGKQRRSDVHQSRTSMKSTSGSRYSSRRERRSKERKEEKTAHLPKRPDLDPALHAAPL